MKLVTQEHISGCAVACVASVLGKSYATVISSFYKGKERARDRGFYCKDIIKAFEKHHQKYTFKYIKKGQKYKFTSGTIVYIEKSKKYPGGHYLCKTEEGWMDPWVNFPFLTAGAGFRKKLPGKAIYMIYK